MEASETSPESYQVPIDLLVPVHENEYAMKGTDSLNRTRCVALTGTVGSGASCTIYENRPSACRKFEASFEYGVKEPRCDEARAAHGLLPLTLRDYDAYRNRRRSD